jgi:hypothetical protein
MMKNKSVYVFGILVFIAITSLIYTFVIRPQYYRFNGGEVYLQTVDTQIFEETYIQMAVIEDAVFLCSKNGLIKKDLDNRNVWSKSFYLETPYMVHSGKYLAVADIMKKSVYVFDEKGFLFEVKEDWPIIDININSEGFLTTVMEGKAQHFINYYNDQGEVVIGRGTRFIEDGYPIAVATSDDLNRMVASYLGIGNNRLQTQIAFFNFEEKYDQMDEKIVGGFTYDNTLPVDVFWINNRTVISILDEFIHVFDVEIQPTQLVEIPLEAEIIDVEVTANELIVLFGDAKKYSESDYANSVCVFDFQGELIIKHRFDEVIEGISGNQDNYFIITQSKIIKFDRKNRIWFSSTYSDFHKFYEVNKSTYIAQSDYGYKILKIIER